MSTMGDFKNKIMKKFMGDQEQDKEEKHEDVASSVEKKAVTPEEVMIRVQSTPNPQALKFVLNKDVKRVGKATYHSIEETYGNVMAYALMDLEPVVQVHMFENVITVTYADGINPSDEIENASAVIRSRYPVHNPDFTVEGDKKTARKDLPPEIQEIEEILDRTIRPGLQADGGDLTVLRLEGKYLEIQYEGACGTCPSATMGTLQAIESILQNEYDPEIRVLLG